MINLAIVGYGYWGKILARNIVQLPQATLHTICDVNKDNLICASQDYAHVNLAMDIKDLTTNSDIDAILLATPIHTHYKLASMVLAANKHVLVEKPLVTHIEQAEKLEEFSLKKNLVLMVDYTPMYSSAAQNIHNLVKNKELGEIAYYDSIRAHYGSSDLQGDVVWDLAVHDIALMSYLLNDFPNAVSAVGNNTLNHHHAATASINLFFSQNKIGYIYVSWLHPEKIRRIDICGTEKTITFDDCQIEDKLKIYDKNFNSIKQGKVSGVNLNNIKTVPVKHNDAVTNMLTTFIDRIERKKYVEKGFATSIKIISLLATIKKSMMLNGIPLELK